MTRNPSGSRSRIAYLLYVLGGGGAVAVAVTLANNGGVENVVVGIAMGAAVWWLAAGMAVRLGKTPRDFLDALSATFGRRGT